MRAAGVVFGIVCGALVGSAAARDPLSVEISPRVTSAPAQLQVQVTVERDRDERRLRVVAESADYFRSSEVDLNLNDARVHRFVWKSLPTGEYIVQAELYGTDGLRASTEMPVIVMPGFVR